MAMTSTSPHKKEVLLIGGGHTHALLLTMWAKMPTEGVRITLISPSVLTPYSGMLPGLIAGHFTHAQTHIDLPRLCQYAGVRFIQCSVSGVDADQQIAYLQHRPPISYDIASINTGITPDLRTQGSATFTTPIKPIANLYERWLALFSKLQAPSATEQSTRIAVVGGGAAAVELALALASRLAREPTTSSRTQLALIHDKSGLPQGYPATVQRSIKRQLKHFNIEIVEHFFVTKIEQENANTSRLTSTDGKTQFANEIFWSTQGRGADWISNSGLPVDSNGFLSINSALKVVHTKNLFGCGDCATIIGQPRPKAGVFAVRQAPTLYRNLIASLKGKPLTPHKSQKSFLSIITGGDKWAVAAKGGVPLYTPLPLLAWHWKRWIDRRFMAKFVPPKRQSLGWNLPQAFTRKKNTDGDLMRCGGCGAKISSATVNAALNEIITLDNDSILIGLSAGDDCSVIKPPPGKLLSQSVDVIKELVSDPYLQGKIAAEHALSDLFAMGATPHSAHAIVSLPFAAQRHTENDLRQLMSGATDSLSEHGCTLLGGHTSEASELSIGFCVNGFSSSAQLSKNSPPQAGDYLVLTKSLGTGMLFAAHNRAAAQGIWIENAIKSMLVSNARAAQITQDFEVNATTDVTGFGLLGHLLEMLDRSNLGARIELDQLPILEGAESVCAQGFVSSLDAENRKQTHQLAPEHLNHARAPLLFDPQTCGGLLISAPKESAIKLQAALRHNGYESASIVGRIEKVNSASAYRVYLSATDDTKNI